jgi:hypothetical protein
VALGDFRKALDAKDVDVIAIACPGHWHAPMAVLGLKAAKHGYVEKPSREASCRWRRRRSTASWCRWAISRAHPSTIKQIHDGLIGWAYFGKTWYSNARKPIWGGPVVAVPATLNWNLWQGPVRSEYKDNIHPCNWRWFFRYGTRESLNNGTHEVYVARWASDVGYPEPREYVRGTLPDQG